MEKNKKETAGTSASELSAEGLRGKQSVRATFRLPNHIIELLGVVAAQLGLKQKSLFDQLIDDEQSLIRIANKATGYTGDKKEHRQKTFVISRRSLQVLDMVAQKKHIPRDILVEYSIQRLVPIVCSEQEKHEKRKLVFMDLKKYLHEGRRMLHKTQQLLGEDDGVAKMLQQIVELCEEKVNDMQGIVERGQRMEKYETG